MLFLGIKEATREYWLKNGLVSLLSSVKAA